MNPKDAIPDFVIPLARAVTGWNTLRGVALCGSRIDASIAANTVPGVRARLLHDIFFARQGVEDDDVNVACLSVKVIGSAPLQAMETFLTADFQGHSTPPTSPGKNAGVRDREKPVMRGSFEMRTRSWRCVLEREWESHMGLG
jgi:ribose 5-phosphate isomerase B